jgi:hypothetical protein
MLAVLPATKPTQHQFSLLARPPVLSFHRLQPFKNEIRLLPETGSRNPLGGSQLLFDIAGVIVFPGGELRLALGSLNSGRPECAGQVGNIMRAFTAKLPKVRMLLESDILAAYKGDRRRKASMKCSFAILEFLLLFATGSRMSSMS